MTEDNFRQYLKEKESVHLPDDFDTKMILRIKEYTNNTEKKKYLKLMYLFFVAGLLLGFTIAITFTDLEFIIGNNKIEINKFTLLIPFIFVTLFLIEKIYKATLVYIGKEKFFSI